MKNTSMQHIISILAKISARNAEGANCGDDRCSGIMFGCKAVATELSESLEDPSILETYLKVEEEIEKYYTQDDI